MNAATTLWVQPPQPPTVTAQDSSRCRSDRSVVALDNRLRILEGRPDRSDGPVGMDPAAARRMELTEHAVADIWGTVFRNHEQLAERVDEVERVVAMLHDSRSNIRVSFPPEAALISEAPCPLDATQPEGLDPNSCPAFVTSSHRIAGEFRIAKAHAVLVGPPEPLLTWRTKCGWHFGRSPGARPLPALPHSWRLICERCCPDERSSARIIATAAVTEAGGLAS